MVQKDVFLMKPKRQYHLSQRGECVYGLYPEIKEDYYANLSLSKSIDEH